MAKNKLIQSAMSSADEGMSKIKNAQVAAYQLGVNDRNTGNEVPYVKLKALDSYVSTSRKHIAALDDAASQKILYFYPGAKKTIVNYIKPYQNAVDCAVPATELYNLARYGTEDAPRDDLSIKNYNFPTQLEKGSYFDLKGTITSSNVITSVTVGVMKDGSWQSVATKTVSPNKKSFGIIEVDRDILFNKLGAGTYQYIIKASDANGSKTLLNKTFTVGNVKSVVKAKKLNYDAKMISKVGSQKTNMCGAYATAYSRTILDGQVANPWTYWIDGVGANWKTGIFNRCKSAKESAQLAFEQIEKGRPCVIYVYNKPSWYTPGPHYVTVIGYKEGTTKENVKMDSLYVIDPYDHSEISLSSRYEAPPDSFLTVTF